MQNIFNDFSLSFSGISDDQTSMDPKTFVLDPMSVIIKLAILGNKPVGTKVRIHANTMSFQVPGLFQALCRTYLNSNKTALQYLYNPIYFACTTYLTSEYKEKNSDIIKLFCSATRGLERIIETYKQNSIIIICCRYYLIVINSFINDDNDNIETQLFTNDRMTYLYTPVTLEYFQNLWTDAQLKIVLELITFLSQDQNAETNVHSLELIIDNFDEKIKSYFLSLQ